jgi:hypothetical protein
MNTGVFPSQQRISTPRFRRYVYRVAGTYMWRTPPGVLSCRVELQGGAGGNSSVHTKGFGGRGSALIKLLPPEVQVVVGAASLGNNNSAGGTSSFGSFATATNGSSSGGSPVNGTFTRDPRTTDDEGGIITDDAFYQGFIPQGCSSIVVNGVVYLAPYVSIEWIEDYLP